VRVLELESVSALESELPAARLEWVSLNYLQAAACLQAPLRQSYTP
jgi:hypothetical protein